MYLPEELLVRRPAGEPARAARVQRVDLGPDEPGHVRLDVEADPCLGVGEVAVADREALEQLRVEHQGGGRVERVEAVLLVDRLGLGGPPTTAAAFRGGG